MTSRQSLAPAFAAALLISACGAEKSSGVRTTVPSTSTSTVGVTASMSEFVAAADASCRAVFPKVAALPDPDGVGGEKQPGLGTIVREWAEELAAIAAPTEIADDWAEATELLRMSGVKLEESEQLAAAGDDTGADAAQSEALWNLQAQAAEIILALDIPFQACSFA